MKQILAIAILAVVVSLDVLGQTRHEEAAKRPAAFSEKGEVEQELMRLEREWLEALKRRDAIALDRILADDFIYTVRDGRFGNKADALVDLSQLMLDSISSEPVSIRVYGNTAVVTLRGRMKGTFRGKDNSGDYVETAVWVKRDGRWQVVSAHLSRIVKQ